MELQPNVPALAPLRGKDPLEGWIDAFAKADPGRAARYREALRLFLGYPGPESGADWTHHAYVHRSPKTLKEYRYAVTEFFEFLARYRGQLIAPHEVTRRDAFAYAEWLAHRGEGRWDFSLEGEKLRDGDRNEDLAIYDAMRRMGTANIAEIAQKLPPDVIARHPPARQQTATKIVDEGWLEGRLKVLMQQDVVTRSPTLEELRQVQPRAGLDEVVDPLEYQYTCIAVRPVSRSTIAQRLAALSSFWKVMQKGENADPESRALLEYNVFDDALSAATKNLTAHKRAQALDRRPDAKLVGRIIAAVDGHRLVDTRNVALLWFLLLMGPRISEALGVRRGEPRNDTERLRYPGWLDRTRDPVRVTLIRKGGFPQQLAVPPLVLGALGVMWAKMAELADEAGGPDKPGYRYHLLLTEPDAPLFPPIVLWGRNASLEEGQWGLWGYRKSLRRQAVQMMLRRASTKAGLTPEERRRIHPHGFRHLAAEAMASEGDVRWAQAMLGHSSIQTTEGYAPAASEQVTRSAQNEILDYLAKGGFWADQPRPEAPVARPAPITTYGRPAREEPPEPAQEAARGPRTTLPSAPAAPVALLPPGEPTETPLVVIGHAVSPEGPVSVYEAMAAGRKPPDVVWSGLPQARWLAEHYPVLPVGFGIGKDSLLPWWQKDAPQPWPVLAPVQAYPELQNETGFLRSLEQLYDEWARSQPTATLALAQWLYFLGMLTVALERRIAGTYDWVTFSAHATVGEDVRAHLDSWLVAWFRKNAHTFQTAQRRFAKVSMPTASESREEYFERVSTDIGVAGLMPTVPELPEWYFEADPVHAIYDRSPAEFAAFTEWLGKLTGTRSSEMRVEERDEQLSFFEQSEQSDERRAEAYLMEFYAIVDELAAPERDRSAAERKRLEEQRDELGRFIEREFRIKVPRRAAGDRGKRAERIARLLREAFPGAEPAPVENVLGDARMFSPEAFHIDTSGHTIAHTERYREQFRREHFGRDSECVMRRIARSMWERARRWAYKGATGRVPTEAEQKRELFITLLAQLAYVVPCMPELEQKLAEEGISYSRPSDVARYMNERIAQMAKGERGEGAVDDLAEEILAVIEEQTQAPARPKRRPVAPNLIENARRAAPHPLRLVAASFWPV